MRLVLFSLTLLFIDSQIHARDVNTKCEPPCIYMVEGDSSILRFPLDNTSGLIINDTPPLKISNSEGYTTALELDPVNRHIYWSDYFYKVIYRSSLDGKNVTKLFDYAIGYPSGIAVDWSSNILYWVDRLMKTIELSDTNGKHRKVLFRFTNGTTPMAICVNAIEGYLFWSDVDSRARIERSSLSGTDRKTIVLANLRYPNDFSIDYESRRLYWVDSIKQMIESVDFDGSKRRSIFDTRYFGKFPISISFHMDLHVAYFTDWLSVYRMKTPTSKTLYTTIQRQQKIRKLRLLQNFKHNASAPCSSNPCSHLCLKSSKHSYVCACPTGMKLSTNSTCVEVERDFEIYFADSYARTVNHLIKYVSQDGFTTKPISISEKLDYPVGLDYDPWSKYIYLSDHRSNKIYRMYEDGTSFENLINGVSKPSGIAIDKITKILYYFGNNGKTLVASSINGTYSKTLVYAGLSNPTDIELYEEKGYIFYSDTNHGYIVRVNTDGSGHISTEGRKRNITAIAIDKIEDRIYWCENDQYSIMSTDLSFKNWKTVIQKTILYSGVFYLQKDVGSVIDPFGLAVLGDKIFWTDTSKRAIFVADKHSGGEIEYITAGLDHPRRIHVYRDTPIIEYRKTYYVSVQLKNRTNFAQCYSTPECSPGSLNQIPDPPPCPLGYNQTNYGHSCSNCSDAVSGRLRCACTDWMTCAQRGYSFVYGCYVTQPYMLFKVRECTQAIHPGVCKFNTSATCSNNTNVCVSDMDCKSTEKCCNTKCGFKCSPSVSRTDHPCTVKNGGCSHFCIITQSAKYFECGCPNDMVLDASGENCILDTESKNVTCDAPCLYVLSKNALLRFPINASTGIQSDKEHVILRFDGSGAALALDPMNSNIFWTDSEHKVIYKSTLDGKNLTRLFDYAVGYPSGIAVDWSSNNLYWVDKLMQVIEMSNTNGKHRRVLFKFTNGSVPHAICVNVAEGYLFWISYNLSSSSPKIERSSLNGINRITIVSLDMQWPNDLSIDYNEKRLYWIDSQKAVIESVKFDGGDRRIEVDKNIAKNSKSEVLYSVSYLSSSDTAYVADVNTVYSVEEASIISKILINPTIASDFYQVRVLENLTNVSTTCLSSDNMCSHLCIKSVNGTHVCACPTGMKLSTTSSAKCVEVERDFEIYFADSLAKTVNHLIKYVSQDGVTTNPIAVPEKEKLQYPVGLDYDPWSKYIYWSDHQNKEIYRIYENGTGFEPILYINGTMHGLAVSKISKVIYWFDDNGRTLKVSSLDGKYNKTLASTGMSNPTDLVLYEEKGLLFFSGFDKIVRIDTLGRNRQTYSTQIQQITGLAIDAVEDRLYWCDQISYSIESTDLYFNNRRKLIQKTAYINREFYTLRNVGFVVEPFGLAIVHDQLFWTDTYKRAIFIADKHSGSNIEYITGGLDHPRRIHAYQEKSIIEHQKYYMFSFYSASHYAVCFHSSCPSALSRLTREPGPCPHGYKQTRSSSTCAACADPVGGNFRCPCTSWETCAQRGYDRVFGCTPSWPYMFFKVRECTRAVHPGVCEYKSTIRCPNSKNCGSDDDCETAEKCCQTGCGMKCSQSIAKADHPCTFNNGGCSHFCVVGTSSSSFQCSCPDDMIINTSGKMCVLKEDDVITNNVCSSPKHLGPCHPLVKQSRWYHNNITKKCEKFLYGGCDGNKNNFFTKRQCDLQCSHNPCVTNTSGCSHTCVESDTPERYNCTCPDDMVLDSTNKNCTMKSHPCVTNTSGCSHTCVESDTPERYNCTCPDDMVLDSTNKSCIMKDICKRPKATGMCQAYFERWYFKASTHMCEKFVYGGCGNNGNNFETKEACQNMCSDNPCVTNTSGCSHTCVESDTPERYNCTCPDNMVVDKTNKSCTMKAIPMTTEAMKTTSDVTSSTKSTTTATNTTTVTLTAIPKTTQAIKSTPIVTSTIKTTAFNTTNQTMSAIPKTTQAIKSTPIVTSTIKTTAFNTTKQTMPAIPKTTQAIESTPIVTSTIKTTAFNTTNQTMSVCTDGQCKNNGTCNECPKCDGGFICKCQEYYFDNQCQLYAGNDVVSVEFKKQSKTAVSPSQLKNTFVEYLDLYCSNNTCSFKTSVQGRGRRESSPKYSTKFTTRDIIITVTSDNDDRVTFDLLVLQPRASPQPVTGYLEKDSIMSMMEMYGEQIANKFGLTYKTEPSNDTNKGDGSGKTKTMVLVVVLVIVVVIMAAILLFYFKYYRKPAKEPAVSFDNHSFDNQLYHDLNLDNHEQTDNKNVSFRNPVYDIPENNPSLGAVGTNSSMDMSKQSHEWVEFNDTEKTKSNDWIEFDEDAIKQPIADFVEADLNNDDFNIESILNDFPPEYSSRMGTPIPRQDVNIPARAISTTSLGLPPRYSSIGIPEDTVIRQHDVSGSDVRNVRTIQISGNTNC